MISRTFPSYPNIPLTTCYDGLQARLFGYATELSCGLAIRTITEISIPAALAHTAHLAASGDATLHPAPRAVSVSLSDSRPVSVVCHSIA